MPSQKTQDSRSHLTLTLLALTVAAIILTLAGAVPRALAASSETCPNQAVREQQHATYLPDCRAYEQASPAQKEGNEVDVDEAAPGAVGYQASMEGAGIVYQANGAFADALSSGVHTHYLSESSSLGSPWQTLSLNPDNRLGSLPPEGTARSASTVRYFSPNLTCGFEDTELPLTALPPGETTSEYFSNLYVWNAVDDSYTLVTNVKPETEEVFNNYYVDGASADCSDVIFESNYPFIKGLEGQGTLYEWHQGTLRIASVLPDGTTATTLSKVFAGTRGSDLNEISSDGARVFFTAEADEGVDNGKQELFMRLNGSETIEVSASQTTPAVPDSGASFQAASESGEQVFFTASYGLTESSSSGETECKVDDGELGCDLYDYNTATGVLSDISADTNAEDTTGADVLGVMGIAEEGGVVYFSATGQLVPGEGNTQATNAAEGEANVYRYQPGKLSYVTSIGESEAVVTAGPLRQEGLDAIAKSGRGSAYTVSRVSSDGEYLLFATDKRIMQSDGTSYDNTDASTGAADFEEYEYSPAAGVTCVSCDPDGAQPRLRAGVDGLFGEFGQYEQTTADTMLRNLANNGEVYFQTTNPVLSQAVNDSVNVYQWQPEGVGSCAAGQLQGCVSILDSGSDPDPSYFEGASANGENVYLTTFAKLAPEDQDGLRDMYDVRVDGGFLQQQPAAECAGEECQGALPGREGASTPASTLSSTNGNVSTKTTVTTPVAKLTIVKHSVKGKTATILARVSAAGKLVASGSDVGKVSKSAGNAKTVTLKLKLTKKGSAALAKQPGKALKVKLELVFTPTSGSKASKAVAISFKPSKTKRKAVAKGHDTKAK